MWFFPADTSWIHRAPPPAPMADLGPNVNHLCEYNEAQSPVSGRWVCVLCGTWRDERAARIARREAERKQQKGTVS